MVLPAATYIRVLNVRELQFIEGTMNPNIPKQSMIPCLQKQGWMAVFQHDNDAKKTPKMTNALLNKQRMKVMEWPSMSPDLNPIEHLWDILQWRVEVSNIHHLCDVVMKEWKRILVATSVALVNSMAKRVKTVLGAVWTFSLRGAPNFVANRIEMHCCVLSYLIGR